MQSHPSPSGADRTWQGASPRTNPASKRGTAWASVAVSVLALACFPILTLVRVLSPDWRGVDLGFSIAIGAFIPAFPALLASFVALLLAISAGGKRRDAGLPRSALVLSVVGLAVGTLAILASVIAFVVMIFAVTPSS
jgi:hypothetical protein